MIIESLVNEYENLKKSNKVIGGNYIDAKAGACIVLNKDGTINNIVKLGTGNKGIDVQVPFRVPRSSGFASNFICDSAKYFFGMYYKKDTNANEYKLENDDESRKYFEDAKQKHIEVLKDASGLMGKAIYNYFNTWSPECAEAERIVTENKEYLERNPNIIFALETASESNWAQKDGEIANIWELKSNIFIPTSGEITCMVTQRKDSMTQNHGPVIGTTKLISLDKDSTAFHSYMQSGNYNVPIGKYASNAYIKTLKYLLGNEDNNVKLGKDDVIVYWSEDSGFDYQDFFKPLLSTNDSEKLNNFFNSIKKDIKVDMNDTKIDARKDFYILWLNTSSKGRISVKKFCRNSFGNIWDNIRNHYERMSITFMRGNKEKINEYISIKDIIDITFRPKAKEDERKEDKRNESLAPQIMTAILEDKPYPTNLYTQVLNRVYKDTTKEDDKNRRYKKAAIIKAVLIKNYNQGGISMKLDKNSDNVAYCLGRLFAVLEAVQNGAYPNLDKTIFDGFFKSAATTPSRVFPQLLRKNSVYISKFKDNESKRGLATRDEKMIVEIMDKITEFPRILNLKEQGMFYIGYYHQRVDIYTPDDNEDNNNNVNEED